MSGPTAAGAWQVNFFWWGKADVTRPCSPDEWDGNLMINGVPHLRAPGTEEPMEPNDAKSLAETLNAVGEVGTETVPSVTGDNLVPRLVAFADKWEIKEPVKAKLARDAAERITTLRHRVPVNDAPGGESEWLG